LYLVTIITAPPNSLLTAHFFFLAHYIFLLANRAIKQIWVIQFTIRREVEDFFTRPDVNSWIPDYYTIVTLQRRDVFCARWTNDVQCFVTTFFCVPRTQPLLMAYAAPPLQSDNLWRRWGRILFRGALFRRLRILFHPYQ